MSAWPFGHLQMFGYDVIVIDPPWNYQLRSEKGQAKSAHAHYQCRDLAWIKALPVGQLARAKTLLFCWATAPMLPEALEAMAAWGFAYKTQLVWRKVTPSGKPRMGPGYVARTLHEPVLVGAIGRGTQEGALPSLFDGVDLFDGIAREHSRKPDEFYELVRRVTPDATRCDVFSRETRPGFDGWGDEVTKFNEADTASIEAVEPTPFRVTTPVVASNEAKPPPPASIDLTVPECRISPLRTSRFPEFRTTR
jgi:N6-adenosine-specific RNA methylase IME4